MRDHKLRWNPCPAERIVCLSHDSVDILINLGAQGNIVGRPAGNKRPEMKGVTSVGGYGSINIPRVVDLKPDIVITYSDFQHEYASKLIVNHVNVLALTHVDMAGIIRSIRILGALVDKVKEAETIVMEMHEAIASFSKRDREISPPSVYFEEWNDPLITGTRWVSEMIHFAGGRDIFKERSAGKNHLDRQVTSEEITTKNPDVIFASWCGKPVDFDSMTTRKGWDKIRAVKENRLYELPGEIVLQPGPSIIKGIARMHELLFSRDA